MTDMLLNDLRQAATPPPPKGFDPGIVYSGRTPTTVTTPWLDEELKTQEDFDRFAVEAGVPLPPGHSLVLAEVKFNQAAWHRDEKDVGTKFSAYTRPMWLYRFKVVEKGIDNPVDLEVMLKGAMKSAYGRKIQTTSEGASFIVNLADFQVGKSDQRGGTEALLLRSEIALKDITARIRKAKPEEIILIDVGDSTEGFESAPNAERTNDLQQTEQIRVWRRIFFRWISVLGDLGPKMKVISVPSNHCSIRRGKNKLGPASDDWGLEVLAQVSDMADQNPERFGHVEFIVPLEHEEHVFITLVGGKTLGIMHGHQAGTANGMIDVIKKQGRRGVGSADIIVVGHFHHLRVINFGDKQWLFVCPTMDPGSAYYVATAGEDSDPGVLAVVVDEIGWRDLYVSWQ